MATIRTTYKYKCDLDKGTLETSLRNSLMQADALADAFAVTVQRNGADVDISGMTVYGYLYASATKTTVPLKGTVSGSTATVILSEDCYAVPGYASLMIQLHDGDVRHTVLKVDFVVTRTGGTLVLDGDNILPTLAELLGQISAMEQATAEARAATDVANQAVENVEAFKGEIQGDITALTEENVGLRNDLVDLSNGKINVKLDYEWIGGVWGSTGAYNDQSLTFVSTKVENVTVGDTLSIEINGEHMLRVVAFDADGIFVKLYTGDYIRENTSFAIEYPQIAFSFGIDGSTPVTVEEVQYLQLITQGTSPIIRELRNEMNEPVFDGCTFISFGDSIMAGDGNSGIGIVDLLISDYGANGNDYAVGGSSMQYYEGHGHIPTQIANAISSGLEEPTIFLLNGLSNDVAYGDNLGVLTDSFDYETKGYANYVDGLEYAIGLLKHNYPNVPIVYFIPHSTPSRVYEREKTFGDMARSVCAKWAVPIVDLYKDGNLNARLTEQKNLYCDDGGTHPNNEGYKKFYMPLIVAKIRELLN